jgi:hypothetical protein
MRTAQGILAFVTLVMLLPMPNPHIRAQAGDVIDDPEMYAVCASVYTCGFDCSGGWHILREKDGDCWVYPKGTREECPMDFLDHCAVYVRHFPPIDFAGRVL